MYEWTDIGHSRVALGILPFVSVSESLYYYIYQITVDMVQNGITPPLLR